MEKKVKMTKMEQDELKEIQHLEAGINAMFEIGARQAGRMQEQKKHFFDRIKKRLGLNVQVVKVDINTGDIQWDEPESK